MLIEEGSLKRYLFYAIGEILLVVIGILIVLQIDNYNKQRIDNNESKINKRIISRRNKKSMILEKILVNYAI